MSLLVMVVVGVVNEGDDGSVGIWWWSKSLVVMVVV